MQQNNLGWNGTQYDKASDAQFQAGISLLGRLVGDETDSNFRLESNATILDLGCGTGRLTAEMAQKFVPNGYVIGIDNNTSMIDEAERKQKEQFIPNMKFELQDARTLVFENDKFDMCISIFCLHWIYTIDDMSLVFNNIAKVMKPGGKFAAMFNIPDSEEHPFLLQRAARTLIRSEKWSKFYTGEHAEVNVLGNEITLNQYRDLLDKNGFIGEVSVHNVGVGNISKQERILSLSALPLFKVIAGDIETEKEFTNDILNEFEKLGMRNEDDTYKRCTPVGIIIAQKTCQ